MNEVIYDTFISYRRVGGSSYAGTIYDFLAVKNFKPFYDRIGMENGRFDEQIRINLINAENFILILSKNSLDRTASDKDDWVGKEITLALKYNLNIVVLVEEDFVFPDSLPKEILDIKKFQQYTFKNNTLNETLNSIESKLLRKENDFELNDPIKDGEIKLGGDYLTLFEDEDRGRIIVRKAPAHLTFFGNKFSGTTSFSASQKWTIKGKIYKKKRLTGIYYAKSILDDGFGTLYLEIKSPSILEGYWCGYDNANNKVFCGKYIFKKIFKNYKIRNIEPKDFSKIIHISDNQLGKDYVTSDLLKEALKNEKCFCLVVEDNKTKKPIGFSLCMINNYQDVLEITNGKEIKELKDISSPIGYIKTVVIDKKYEGFGIASNLIDNCIKKLRSMGVNNFISTAWKHCGVTNIANVLLKNGFYKSIELPDYWLEDSIKKGYECPQCGYPCHCSCVIYIKL